MSHGCGFGFGFSGRGAIIAGVSGGEVWVVIEQDIWYKEPAAAVLLIQPLRNEDEFRVLATEKEEKRERPQRQRTVADDAVLEITHATFIVLSIC